MITLTLRSQLLLYGDSMILAECIFSQFATAVRFPVHVFASWPSRGGECKFSQTGRTRAYAVTRSLSRHAARKHSSKEEEEEEEPEFDSSGDEI